MGRGRGRGGWGWRGCPPRRAHASSARRRSCTRRERGRAVRCSCRVASSGVSASGTTFARSVRRATRHCSGVRLGAARRRDRMARIARRAGGRARHRQSAHDRKAVRSARLDRDACSRGGRRRLESTRRRADDPCDRRLPGERGAGRRAHPSRRLAPLRANPGAAATACVSDSRGAPSSLLGWRSSTAATCPTPTSSEDIRPARAALRPLRAASTTSSGRSSFPGEVSWSENDLVQATAQQPGARAWYVLDDAALERRCATAPWRRSWHSRRRESIRLSFRSRRRQRLESRCESRPASRTRSEACASTIRPESWARTASSPQVRMLAASRPAVTRAAWPRRSCSAGEPAAESAATELEVRAGTRIVRQRRGADLDYLLLAVVDLDARAHRRRFAVSLPQLVAAGLPYEQEIPACAVDHRPRILAAGAGHGTWPTGPLRTAGARRAPSCRLPRPGRR